MASSYVGGLSGAFIPVSEDQGMIDAVNAGSLCLEKLEAMTCVCSVGLDMIAIPGKTSAATISGIIADEMAIGMVNQKTTAVRLIPVIGKDVGDVAEFGRLMNASHVSLRDDYEVTGKELDTLVDTAWKQDGVIGSRMTGAGFGGCTVSIVKEDAVKNFIENVGKIYEEKIGYKADFYVVEIGDGAGIWE